MSQTIGFGILAGLAMAVGATGLTHAADCAPQGELLHRVNMARDRILHGKVPEFSADFILADVALRPDYPRRFDNYSGDISGRYVGAFATMPDAEAAARLTPLVATLLGYQKADGRFGNADLQYTPEAIELDHMALLWGNGRLLTGLLEYNAFAPDTRILEASRRLGDFLLGVRDACANEAVTRRVADLGAAGMICFSQLVEPLVMLAEATGDAKYLEGAENVVPWLPQERGTQHSHGYLSTLRGFVMLADATGKSEYLDLAKHLYDDLVSSSDYLPYGGVMEYFGGKGDNDEGCSEADFLRLSLQLGDKLGTEYYDRAEFCLENQFSANQFHTGDFGHHAFFADGILPRMGTGLAWWCCDMHGIRAYRDVLDYAVTPAVNGLRVNLYIDADWSDGGAWLQLRRNAVDPAEPYFAVQVTTAPADGVRLAVRKPLWADTAAVAVDGHTVDAADEDGYLVPAQPLRQGQTLTLACDFSANLLTPDRQLIPAADLGDAPMKAALIYGPWLLGVDEGFDPLFVSEPWASNEVHLPAAPRGTADASAGPLAVPAGRVTVAYVHGGFPGTQPVTLRPIRERTAHPQATFGAFLNYRRAPEQ